MDIEKLKQYAIEHHKGAFEQKWGKMWFADVMKPIVDSIIKNEKLREEQEKKIFYHYLENDRKDTIKFYPMILELQTGLILLLCQSYISQVISMVRHIHSDLSKIFGVDFSSYPYKKMDLISNFNPKVNGTEYTEIEVIDALANYFKHHEEWGGKISSLTGNSRRTADIVSQIGADLSMALWSSRNLTICIKRIGVTSLDMIYIIPGKIDTWKQNIGNQYKDYFSRVPSGSQT
ncbi:MAG: hypothetical protein WC602_02235 [archaeon]